MSKHDTQYAENERALTHIHLNRFGINPFAADLLIRSYIINCAPQPVSIMYEVIIGEVKEMVEIHLSKPGFVGKVTGLVQGGLDKFGLKLFARSYYENVRPKHLSFVYYGVEVHLRTPGVDEDDHKNIARNIFNPTT